MLYLVGSVLGTPIWKMECFNLVFFFFLPCHSGVYVGGPMIQMVLMDQGTIVAKKENWSKI